MINNRFCYRISKEAEMCIDEETNEYGEAYIQTTIKTEKEINSKLKNSIAENLKLGLANQLDTNVEYLQYITPEEYDKFAD